MIKMNSPAHAVPASPARPFPPEITDLDAIKGVAGGDQEMFAVIVRRYNPRLYRVGMAYLRNHAQAEDAMQNAYLKAYLHLPRFRGDSAFSTWLTRIMINECLMILRTEARLSRESIHAGHLPMQQEPFLVLPADPLHSADMRALLEKAVEALPRTHRAVYLLREVQQLSTGETAQCLGMSCSNVKVTLHRAREGLKSQLMKSAARVELFDYSAQYCDPMTARVMQAIHGTSPWSATHPGSGRAPETRAAGVSGPE